MCISKSKLLSLLLSLPTVVCYDNEGEGGEGAGAGSGTGEGAGGAGDGSQATGKTFNQDDVNKLLAEDRRKHQAKMKTLEDKLSATLQTAQLTQQERTELETSLDDVRKQLMTKEQVAAQEKKKLESQYKTQLEQTKAEAEMYKHKYTDSTITRSLLDAAATGDAYNPEQVVTLLKSKAKLVDGDNVVIDFHDRHVDTGEPIVTQLSPHEAVKRMRELPEIHGNLFKANVSPGVGANSGTTVGGKIDVTKLTPEQYRKLRKENPGALGFRK